VQVIFRQLPKVASRLHFGSQAGVRRDGRLFVTLGDRFSRKDDAQTLDNHLGKIVRIEPDGKVPADNPFVGRAGHRGPRSGAGATATCRARPCTPPPATCGPPSTAPQGGDELNLVQPGRNFGWPVITPRPQLRHRHRIGDGTERADVVAPLPTGCRPRSRPAAWPSSPATATPAGRATCSSARCAARRWCAWTLDGNRWRREERLLQSQNERIRDVRQGPDGFLYLLTDNADGQIWRLERP
jgi:glucose/arabinose dehydrogenase